MKNALGLDWMKDQTVIQHTYDSHYEGAAQAAQFVRDWTTLEGRINQPLYEQMREASR